MPKIRSGFITTTIMSLSLLGISSALALSNVSLRAILAQNQFAQTQIIYNQNRRADREIVAQIQKAKQFVYFAVYTLTKQNIADAIIAAKLRGLDVRGVLDQQQSAITQEKPWLAKFKKYGIEIKIPNKPGGGLMHVKMLVTDQSYALGSFNWTTSGTYYNDEILEIGQVQSLRLQCLAIFNQLFAYP